MNENKAKSAQSRICTSILETRAGSLNRAAIAAATDTADSTAAKKIWIFKSFSRITQGITREFPNALNH